MTLIVIVLVGVGRRFATVLGLALALLATGLVSGASGDQLILGTSNSSGASGTTVSTSVNGNAFRTSHSGTGNSADGLRGDASHGTGGVFTSINNTLFRHRFRRQSFRHGGGQRRQCRHRRRGAHQRVCQSGHRGRGRFQRHPAALGQRDQPGRKGPFVSE